MYFILVCALTVHNHILLRPRASSTPQAIAKYLDNQEAIRSLGLQVMVQQQGVNMPCIFLQKINKYISYGYFMANARPQQFCSGFFLA